MLKVISSERKDSKKGKWLVLVCKNEKDQDRTFNVFDSYDLGKEIISTIYKGPGKYDYQAEKIDGYMRLTKFELISLDGASAPAAAPAQNQAAPATQPAQKASRADIAMACVAAAGNAYQGIGGADNNDLAAVLARTLMAECAKFINGAEKPKTEPAPEREPVGA